MSYTYNPLLYSGFQQTPGALAYNGFKSPVATATGLPTVGNSPGDARVALDTDHIWVWDGITLRWVDTGLTQANVGVTPNNAGYSLTLDNTQPNLSFQDLILQPADNTHPGVLTAGAQTIGGNKTLSGTTNLSGLTASNPLQLDASKNIISAPIDLTTTQISGVLPVAHGGTNSSTALNNNRVIISSSGAIVENAAITGSRALASNASGLPVASVTTDTELGYVSGVTSAIQTQLNAKENLANKGVAFGYAPLDGAAKVPYVNLPSALMTYKGAWNPTTNTPTLTNGVGTNGDTYRASVDGASTSPIVANWFAGDFIIYDGSVWQRSPLADGVVSVNGASGIVTVNAINQLTGDVTAGPASGSQSQAATIAAGAVGPTKLGTVTDGVTLDQAGAGSTIEVKSGGISNTQVNAAAAIARSKLANGTANSFVTNNASGVMQSTTVTANRALASDSSGLPTQSNTTDTELNFVSGVTSAIQTQLNGKASTTLNNLGTTSINSNLLPSADNTRNLGSASLRWSQGYINSLLDSTSTLSLSPDLRKLYDTSGLSAVSWGTRELISPNTNAQLNWSNGGVTIVSNPLDLNSHKVINVTNPTAAQDAVTLSYLQANAPTSSTGDINQTSFSMANNQAAAANVTGLAFANASVRSAQVQYSITVSATSSLYEEGILEMVQKGATWDWSQKANFDNTNVIFSVTNAGQIQYTTPNYSGFASAKLQFRALVTNV